MKRLIGVLLVVFLAGFIVLGQDNPFARPTIKVLDIVSTLRMNFQPRLIEISEKNPITLSFFPYFWLLGYPQNALESLYDALQAKPIFLLTDLMTVKYWGGESKLIRLLLVFRFPDEEKALEKATMEAPQWWGLYPLK